MSQIIETNNANAQLDDIDPTIQYRKYKYLLYITDKYIGEFYKLTEIADYLVKNTCIITSNHACRVLDAIKKNKIRVVEVVYKKDGSVKMERDYMARDEKKSYKLFINYGDEEVKDWVYEGIFGTQEECFKMILEVHPDITPTKLNNIFFYGLGKQKYNRFRITFSSERDRIRYNKPDYTLEQLNNEPKIIRKKIVFKPRQNKRYVLYIKKNDTWENVGVFPTYKTITPICKNIYPDIKDHHIQSIFSAGWTGLKKFDKIRIAYSREIQN